MLNQERKINTHVEMFRIGTPDIDFVDLMDGVQKFSEYSNSEF